MKLTVASFLSFHLVLFLNEVHRVFVVAADGSDYEDLDVEVAAKPAERAVKLIASFNSEMTELMTETGLTFADLPAGGLKTFNTYLGQPIVVRRGKGGDADAVLGKVVPEGKEEQVFVIDENGVREATNKGRRKMVIENAQTETVTLSWINPETRAEISMQDIAPQGKWEHAEVVVGHRYMVRSSSNKDKAVALIRVSEEDEQKHVITQSSQVTDKELEALEATAAAEDEDGDDAEEAEDDSTADEEADEEEGDGEEGDDSEQEEGDDSEGDGDSADDEEDGGDDEKDDDSEPADEEEAGDDSEEGDADEKVKEEL